MQNYAEVQEVLKIADFITKVSRVGHTLPL